MLEKSPQNKETQSVEVKQKPRGNLIIERGKIEQFDNLPEKSVALDGYVQGPGFDLEKSRFSLDHHDKVNRMITKATCQQVLDLLLLGFDPTEYNIYLNDIDGDTVLSVWLLRHPDKVTDPKVRMLVESVGGIDSHGPAYTALDPKLSEIFFKIIMKPERLSRTSGQYAQTDLNDLLEVCLKNIDDFMEEKLEYTLEEDKRSFDIVKEGSGWVMAESKDFVFDMLYKAGYTRAVVFHKQPDGSYAYTVAKKSELVSNFPVGPVSKEGTLLNILNQREAGWGGSSTIGGAPRNADGSRSHLAPEEVFDIIESIVKK
jgi:hypothetical protein